MNQRRRFSRRDLFGPQDVETIPVGGSVADLMDCIVAELERAEGRAERERVMNLLERMEREDEW